MIPKCQPTRSGTPYVVIKTSNNHASVTLGDPTHPEGHPESTRTVHSDQCMVIHSSDIPSPMLTKPSLGTLKGSRQPVAHNDTILKRHLAMLDHARGEDWRMKAHLKKPLDHRKSDDKIGRGGGEMLLPNEDRTIPIPTQDEDSIINPEHPDSPDNPDNWRRSERLRKPNDTVGSKPLKDIQNHNQRQRQSSLNQSFLQPECGNKQFGTGCRRLKFITIAVFLHHLQC